MRYEREGDSFHNINSSVLFTGKVDWESKQFIPDSVEEIDHGQDFYAPQTLVDDQGRRIMVAWMQMWGRNIPSHELGHKWAGAMTLPRQLELIDGKLYQRILPSTETAMTPVYLNEPIRGFSRFQVEVIEGVHYQLGTTDDFLAFGYNADAEEVYIDRSHLKQAISGEETISTSRRFVSCRAEKLDVVFDCNSIEIFVNDGREVLSATYYLTGEKYLTKVS